MKKMFNILLAVCMVLVLAPLSVDAKAQLKDYKCTTSNDATDSTRKITDCDITLYNVETGELDGKTVDFTVKYIKPTDKSDFLIMDDTSGLSSEVDKTEEGGTFKFTFNDGLKGDIVAFKVRFYSDINATGEDCGGTLSFVDGEGKTSTGSTSTNTEASSGNTGVSAPAIILGVGVVACLAVYASTSKKTKMHRI